MALNMPVRCWASAPTRTFSNAVIDLNRRMFWNVRAIPSWMILYLGSPVRDRPWKRTSPEVGR